MNKLATWDPIKTSFMFAQEQFKCVAYVFKSPAPVATLILLPAIGVAALKYQAFIDACLSTGINLVIADYPGNGESLPRPSRQTDYSYQDLVTEFVPELINIAEQYFPAIPNVLTGHSLGGHVMAQYSHWTGGKALPGVAIGGGNIHFKHWDGINKFGICMIASLFYLTTLLFGYLPGKKLGLGRYEAKTLIRQWGKVSFSGNYQHIPFPRKASPSKTNPALFIGIKEDKFAPARSILALAEFYAGDYQYISLNSPRPLTENPHSSWLKAPDSIVSAIKLWLQNKVIL